MKDNLSVRYVLEYFRMCVVPSLRYVAILSLIGILVEIIAVSPGVIVTIVSGALLITVIGTTAGLYTWVKSLEIDEFKRSDVFRAYYRVIRSAGWSKKYLLPLVLYTAFLLIVFVAPLFLVYIGVGLLGGEHASGASIRFVGSIQVLGLGLILSLLVFIYTHYHILSGKILVGSEFD